MKYPYQHSTIKTKNMQYTLNNKRQAVLEKIIESFESGAVSKEEFIKVMTTFKGLLNDMKVSFDSGMDDMGKDVTSAIKDIKEMIDVFEKKMNKMSLSLESSHSEEMKEMEKMMKDCEKEMSRIEAMIPDVTDLTPLERKIENYIEEIEKKIPSFPEEMKGEAIVKKVNSLPLEREYQIGKEHIRDLEKEIAELREIISRIGNNVSGGVSNLRIQQAFKYILKKEEPVGDIDGVNTEYTVSQPIFGIFSFSLNGETIAELPNYTISGNKITFSVALPAAYSGKDFEIRYV